MTIQYTAGKIGIGTSAERLALTLGTTDAGFQFRDISTGEIHIWSGYSWLSLVGFGQLAKTGRWTPWVAATSGDQGLLGPPAAFGTAGSAPAVDTSRQYFPWTTGTVINTTAGVRFGRFTFRGLDPHMMATIKLPSVANVRCFIGFSSHTASVTTTADPLASQHGVGLWYDSAVNANWRIMSNNSTTTTNVDTTVAAGTGITTMEIKAIDATPAFQWRIGTTAWSSNVTATLPATGLFMCIVMWIECLASSDSKEIRFFDLHVQQKG